MKKLFASIVLLALLLPTAALAAKPLYQYGSFEQRKVMAVNFGIVATPADYFGTYSQNVSLLSKLSNETLGGTTDPFQPSGISINIRESLVSGSARTQTTLNIDPIVTLDGHRVTFADFNSSIAFAKLDQGTSNEEIISFTGITDNTTYYTLTGVIWGYDFYRTTGSISANKKKHNSGGKFTISTDFHFINANYVSIGSTQSITGTKIFSGGISFSSFPNISTTSLPTFFTNVATKLYVDTVAIAGAPNADITTKGIVELVDTPEWGNRTPTGGTGAFLVAPNAYFATTSQGAIGFGYGVVSRASDGKIDPSFIATSSNYTWSGNNTYSGTSTFTGAAFGAGFTNISVYTASTTWTKPAGVTKIKVRVVGGGGNGAAGGGSGNIGGGGGGGGYAEEIIDVTGTTSVAVTVGLAGQTSSFGSYLSATGGANGSAGSLGTWNGAYGGAGGVGSNGNINLQGSGGGSGSGVSGQFGSSGSGGSSVLGGGAVGANGAYNGAAGGSAGGNYGGGGSGGVGTGTGGAGAQGVVIVEY